MRSKSVAFFDETRSGEIVARLTADVQDFKSSFKTCASQGLRAAAQTLGCLVALYSISPELTGLMMGVVMPTVFIAGASIGSGLRSMSRKAQEQVAKATSVGEEAVNNIRTVKAFAMEEEEIKLYCDEVDKSASLNETLGFGIGLFQGATNVFLNGIVLGTLYYGFGTSHLSAGELTSFLVATQTIQRSLTQMTVLLGQVVKGVSAGARVFEFTEEIVEDKASKIIPYHSLMGELCFNHVDFAYPTRKGQKVLEDFNLRVPAGKTVALVGASGGGKSTVASLLERFYDPDGGNVTLDGVDIAQLDAKWLRGRTIGYINQEPVLFATTVRENIRYGNPEASDIEVEEAAKSANADDFIKAFPNGYDTMLGERGVTVSGGQKQRIAIARALIKNPQVLLLDEATSALDAEAEAVVQSALDEAGRGRTVLVIAHRLSTVRNADEIAVVVKGKIVEVGNHESLMRKKGIYAELVKRQQNEI